MDEAPFSSASYHNVPAFPDAPYGILQRSILNREAFTAAHAVITSWPGYRRTPLRSLPGLSSEVGVGEIRYKDEAERFGLDSFKALGGA